MHTHTHTETHTHSHAHTHTHWNTHTHTTYKVGGSSTPGKSPSQRHSHALWPGWWSCLPQPTAPSWSCGRCCQSCSVCSLLSWRRSFCPGSPHLSGGTAKSISHCMLDSQNQLIDHFYTVLISAFKHTLHSCHIRFWMNDSILHQKLRSHEALTDLSLLAVIIN